MKKVLALIIALALAVSLCTVFVNAAPGDAVNIKSITFESTEAGVVNAVPRGGGDPSALIDGDAVDGATAFATKGVVLFCNTRCTEAGVYPTFSLVLELEKEAVVSGASIALYEESSSMIGVPADGQVTVEYSDDGKDFAWLGDIALGCIDSNEDWGKGSGPRVHQVEKCDITFDEVTTKYIRLTFAYGDSPFDDAKVIWEWMGLTEIGLTAVEAGDEPSVEPSSEESKEESSKEEPSKEEPSKEESSEESKEEPSTAPSENTNLALGATVLNSPEYVITDGQWPADYSGDLTDGITGTRAFDNKWAAFYKNTKEENPNDNFDGKCGEVVVDLGKKADLTSFRTHIWGAADSGIAEVSKVEFFVSDDNVNWTSVGAVTEGLDGADTCWAELEAKASGRYVKYAYTMTEEAGKTGVFLFVSECEAYGTVAGSEPSTSTPTTSEKPTEPTSDSGIIALALVSALAVAGAVIVKKSR